jgi:hypothetical protein
MPETAVNENGKRRSRKNEVRFSGKAGVVHMPAADSARHEMRTEPFLGCAAMARLYK